jgi:hypothetical protein
MNDSEEVFELLNFDDQQLILDDLVGTLTQSALEGTEKSEPEPKAD